MWAATTPQVRALSEYLGQQRVSLVVMEATGNYWKPFYYPMEAELNVMLVNAQHAKNLPGRKTDVSDAQWLAELGAHGLVRASFVPPEPIRELRELTRARATSARERTREIQRLEKLLEDAGLKLSSVATQITGVSCRAMLAALIAGERDPAILADLAKGRLRNKTAALTEALEGRFTSRHAFMTRERLDRIDAIEASITRVEQQIASAITIAGYDPAVTLLRTIPGVSTTVAHVIIAETGADMTRFPTAAHLASRAGLCPGHNESAGKVKSSQIRPGNTYLKAALGIAAMAAARNNGTYRQARYKRLAARRGPMRALVTTEHAMIISIWHMLTTGETYNDLGTDFHNPNNPTQARRRAIAQLQHLGYQVALSPTT